MSNIGHITARDRLRSFVERIERLEAERQELATDIRDIKLEAKSAGFDVKVINQMIRERKLSQAERDEQIALAELYRAALGMLNDTPLSEAARSRLEPAKAEAEPKQLPAPGEDAEAAAPVDAPKPEVPEVDIDAAREAGATAFTAGKKVTQNPFVFGDKRRAAWDMGWCSRAGSDGMEIPEAWRRSPRKAAGKPAGEGA